MATNNQTEQNNDVSIVYTIYGTNQPYSGKVVNIGNRLFTTQGGALEGNSYEVIMPSTSGGNQNTEENLPTMSSMNQQSTTAAANGNNQNPVTRTFTAPQTPRYRRNDNNQLVPIGGKLHQHQDGTIMTEHSMGPNDNSVIVTRQTTRGTPPTGEGTTPPAQTGGQASNQNINQGNQGNQGGGGGMY